MEKIKLNSQAFEPILKKIEELDKIQRLAICIITISAMGALFYFFSAAPLIKEIKDYKAEYETTDQKLGVAKQKAAKLVKLQNERQMKEAEFRKVMKALPEKREIPSLLTSISQAGQDTGIEFDEFKPNNEVDRDFYGEIPVNLSISGSYHNTIMFFDKVTSLSRIVNIKNVEMTLDSKQDPRLTRIKTKCQAVTYKFVDQTQKDKAKKDSRKKRKK